MKKGRGKLQLLQNLLKTKQDFCFQTKKNSFSMRNNFTTP